MNRSSNILAARTGLFVILASASLAVGGARTFTTNALTPDEDQLQHESQAVDVETLQELWIDIDSELDQLHNRIDDLEDHGGMVPGGGMGGIAAIFDRFFAIPGNTFQPRTNSTVYSKDVFGLSGSGTGSVQFFAPVHLPHGAVVAGLEAQVVDNDAAQNISFQLAFVTETGAGGGMASLASAGASTGTQTLSTSTITQGATIDNKSRCYYVNAFWNVPSTSFNIKLLRVEVYYTVTEPLP